MFARNNRRFRKFAQKFERAVGVVYIIVAKLFALQLLCKRQRARNGKSLAVESRVLLRVFAVAHVLLFLVGERDLFGKTYAEFFAHIGGNHGVVYCGMLKHLIHESEFELHAQIVRFKARHNFRIVGGVYNHANVAVVFCSASQHCGTAYVYVLDSFFERCALF